MKYVTNRDSFARKNPHIPNLLQSIVIVLDILHTHTIGAKRSLHTINRTNHNNDEGNSKLNGSQSSTKILIMK